MHNVLTGYSYAVAAYVIWGLFPVYWKWLSHVEALEVLAHRIVWTVPFVAVVLTLVRRWHRVGTVIKDRRQVLTLTVTTVLIAVNWGIYIWAVNHDQVVQASLGYFLTPLLSVLLGMLLFHERLRMWQWIALAMAAAGVVNQLFFSHAPSWVSLGVGLSFAGYGALRKLVSCDSATGLFVETMLLTPVALAWMWWLGGTGSAAFLHTDWTTDSLLVFGGVMTGTPLLFYVAAGKRLPLATLGFVFYLTPTLQFLLGVFVYGEPIELAQSITFIMIWAGLVLHTAEGRLHARRVIAPEVT